MMTRTVLVILSLIIPGVAVAAGGGHTYPRDQIEIDWSDKAAMQRGARTFVNYCLSCHSAAYSRFNRVAEDLGIPEDLARDNLIFTTDMNGEKTKIGNDQTENNQYCPRHH